MIKVLQVNKLYFPYVGGVEVVAHQIAKNVSGKNNLQVDLLVGSERVNLKKEVMDEGNFKVYKSPALGKKFNVSLSPSYPFLFKKMVKEYDIIHFHIPSPIVEASHFLFSIPKDKKVVVTFHADVASTRWKFISNTYNKLVHKILKRADKIILTSPANLEHSQIIKQYQHKCEIIPLAMDDIDVSEISNDDLLAFKNKYKLPDEKLMLFLGRICYYKGIDVLLNAIKNLNVKLLMVGEGPQEEKIRKMIVMLGLTDKVIMTGFLSRKEVLMSYMVSDFFVLPSVTAAEAFGIVQVEAMHFGLPVINTSLPSGVPFVSLNNQSGFTVTPSSVEELKNAIDKMISDDDLRKQFSEAAKKRSEEFTVNKMAEKYTALYHSLV